MTKFSIITPNYNGGAYLEEAIKSVVDQRRKGADIEYIVVDGGSTDSSQEIFARFRDEIDCLVIEPDNGPANAVNKGLRRSTGDILAWLNADDFYFPGSLEKVGRCFETNPTAPFCFGACPIVDTGGREIRKAITRFKELFFPVSSRFTYQCINYISQPAFFFRRSAFEKTGLLREDMKAAWDYEFILRLWREGIGVRVSGEPVAAFRWHEASISGSHFKVQFREELEAAVRDAGGLSPQALMHSMVRLGIVGSYSIMSFMRRKENGQS